MSIDLYCYHVAPITYPILQLAKKVGVKVNRIEVDTSKNETKTPEFMKVSKIYSPIFNKLISFSPQINPQHCVPTLVEGDFILWEGRAILGYLANAYDKTGKLYPTDPKIRAKVDQKLFFCIGTIYNRLYNHFWTIRQKQPIDPEKYSALEEAMALLDGDLAKHDFVAGDELTIADYSLIAAAGFLTALDIPMANYPHILKWVEKLRDLEVEVPVDAIETLRQFINRD